MFVEGQLPKMFQSGTTQPLAGQSKSEAFRITQWLAYLHLEPDGPGLIPNYFSIEELLTLLK